MYDYQNAVQKMFIEILKFLKDNPELIKDNPILKKHYENLQSWYNELIKFKKIQETDFKGITKDKNKAKAGLAKDIFKLTGAIRSYATDNNNKDLYNKFDSSMSNIKYSKDVDVISYSELVSSSLNKLKDELKPYGVTAEATKKLEDDTAAFNNLLALPAQMRKNVKVATGEIKAIITKIITLLSDSIDNDMLQYSNTQPILYKQYQTLREIDDSQTDHLSLCGTVTDQETNNPLQYVKVTVKFKAGADLANSVKTTSKKGNYQFKGLPEGICTVTFQKNYYDTLTVNSEIHTTTMTHLNVAIRKTE